MRAADAFAFVTPEYNHSPSPALVNALDYLSSEWHYKPAAFVSYGGVSGGLRAAQMTRLIVVGLRMMPIPENISIQHYAQYLDEEKTFTPPAQIVASVEPMLDELHKWAESLKALRTRPSASCGPGGPR
ncbi:NADPH-dependent FMN reductase [Microvirga sp. TS319]|uniref:NADPH-dependent FMN reductase n=1 Tax=Microvirga sp. TS319 TaxID=3241165 RepID=UPI00351A6663